MFRNKADNGMEFFALYRWITATENVRPTQGCMGDTCKQTSELHSILLHTKGFYFHLNYFSVIFCKRIFICFFSFLHFCSRTPVRNFRTSIPDSEQPVDWSMLRYICILILCHLCCQCTVGSQFVVLSLTVLNRDVRQELKLLRTGLAQVWANATCTLSHEARTWFHCFSSVKESRILSVEHTDRNLRCTLAKYRK